MAERTFNYPHSNLPDYSTGAGIAGHERRHKPDFRRIGIQAAVMTSVFMFSRSDASIKVFDTADKFRAQAERVLDNGLSLRTRTLQTEEQIAASIQIENEDGNSEFFRARLKNKVWVRNMPGEAGKSTKLFRLPRRYELDVIKYSAPPNPFLDKWKKAGESDGWWAAMVRDEAVFIHESQLKFLPPFVK